MRRRTPSEASAFRFGDLVLSHVIASYAAFLPVAVMGMFAERADIVVPVICIWVMAPLTFPCVVIYARFPGPWWWPFILGTYVVAGSVAFNIRYRRSLKNLRRVSGLCVMCGYSLTGNTSGTCPECGAAIAGKVGA